MAGIEGEIRAQSEAHNIRNDEEWESGIMALLSSPLPTIEAYVIICVIVLRCIARTVLQLVFFFNQYEG